MALQQRTVVDPPKSSFRDVHQARILIVDDQLANVALVEEFLDGAAYHDVISTTDPRQVVALFEEFQPDIVLLDLHMPHLDGFAVMDQLRGRIPPETYLPILVLTTDISRAAKQDALSRGARDFVSKPFDSTEVVLRIRNLLETRFLHQQLAARTRLVRELLGRYVADSVVEHLLADPDRARLGGQRADATVLFGDLRGFTALIEPRPAEEAVALINSFLSPMVEVLFEHGGTLDKFRGDGIMAIFGVPESRPDDALRAVRAAVAMQQRVGETAVPGMSGRRLQMGIGINSGPVIAGNIGSPQRHDFTVVGDVVNLAARFETSAGPGQILITEHTFQRVAGQVEVLPLGTLRVSGKTEWVPAYQVLRISA